MWEDNSVQDRILHGQWSTPSVGKIGGVDQVVSAQGDGWVRGYEARYRQEALGVRHRTRRTAVWPKTRNEVISTPVIYQDKVYIANGQDPEHGEGRRPSLLHRRDQARRHHADRPGVAVRQDPALDLDGGRRRRTGLHPRLQRLPALPRREDRPGVLEARHVRGGVGFADGRRRAVYLGDEDGDVYILQAGKVQKVLAKINMGRGVTSTVVPAHGTLFVMTMTNLYALATAAAAH